MSLLKRLKKAEQETLKKEHVSDEKISDDVFMPKKGTARKEDPDTRLKNNIHQQLVAKLGRHGDRSSAEIDEELVRKIPAIVEGIMEKENIQISVGDKKRMINEIINESIGLGPIQPLLNDPEITEIMVNGPRQVYIEKKGKLEKCEITFRDDDHVMHVIEKIVTPLGRRIDEGMPMVDARLPDGSRVNCIIPPLSLIGPTITIRKFSRIPFSIEDLQDKGTLGKEMSIFLEASVLSRLNIIVSGGTGSGKTTTLNVLSSFIPSSERIITIEDAAELQLQQEHVISLESRPPNIEGKGMITIRDLVRNSLRMRPERIVVGEVRSGEALDMLQAMNTGHDGSITTGHANSPRDMLSRVETMVLMAGMDLPVRAIREQIASAIDLIVHQARMKDGSRKITHITEVQGMEGDVIILQDLFVYDQEGVDETGRVVGVFRSTGIRPRFMQKLETQGIKIPLEVFAPEI
ncbi:MAG: CpaF family protein [Firmicutes bacterium]|nr:CpaF family protein [Bacillota bacterium]